MDARSQRIKPSLSFIASCHWHVSREKLPRERSRRSRTRRDSCICRLEYLKVLTEFEFGMMKRVILTLGQAIDPGLKLLQMLGTCEYSY